MATDAWIEFDGQELVNISRTVQLAAELGIDSVWTTPESVQWIEDRKGGLGYSNISEAPWYDPGYPASAEFAGILPVSFAGLDDSTSESSPVQYIGDGGHSGRTRNGSLELPAKVYVVASTDRGAEFGKRWLDRTLRGRKNTTNCSGAELRYFRYPDEEAPEAHRRDVKTSRGTQVISKRSSSCSVTWVVTFTLTAADSYEYGDPTTMVSALGGTPIGAVLDSGSVDLIQQSCPVFDYSPVYDPLFPALVPSPTAPNFYPDGWGIAEGMTFRRSWARLSPLEPTDLLAVPLVTLSATAVARMVRVSIWSGSEPFETQCGPLWTAIVSFLPAATAGSPDTRFIIDGEQKASYVFDGLTTFVRRSDSLVFGTDASPIQWSAFTDPDGLIVTLDTFAVESGGFQGDGTVRASIALIPKSD